jgi:hypothetical protein
MHWQHIWTINCTSILWRPSLAKASQNSRRGIPWFITVHWKQKRISKGQHNNSHKMTQAPVKNPVKKIKIAPDDCFNLSAFNAAIKVLPLIWGFPRKFMALPPILQFLLSSNFCWNPPSYPLNQELSHWNNSNVSTFRFSQEFTGSSTRLPGSKVKQVVWNNWHMKMFSNAEIRSLFPHQI